MEWCGARDATSLSWFMTKRDSSQRSSRPYERLDAWQACHELALVV
jgi:hypothetical protein